MANPVVALIAGGSAIVGSSIQAKAAKAAGRAQEGAAYAGIEAQKEADRVARETLRPFVESGYSAIQQLSPFAAAGEQALEKQLSLAGLKGPEAQQAIVDEVLASPIEQARMRAMREQIAGGQSVRGRLGTGETQFGLGEVPVSVIDQYYSRLGGLSSAGLQTSTNLLQAGQASAANTAAGALQTGAGIANLLGQAGAARAGGYLGAGSAYANLFNLPLQVAGAGYIYGKPPIVGG